MPVKIGGLSGREVWGKGVILEKGGTSECKNTFFVLQAVSIREMSQRVGVQAFHAFCRPLELPLLPSFSIV